MSCWATSQAAEGYERQKHRQQPQRPWQTRYKHKGLSSEICVPIGPASTKTVIQSGERMSRNVFRDNVVDVLSVVADNEVKSPKKRPKRQK